MSRVSLLNHTPVIMEIFHHHQNLVPKIVENFLGSLTWMGGFFLRDWHDTRPGDLHIPQIYSGIQYLLNTNFLKLKFSRDGADHYFSLLL